ncbi:hypothetical protein TPHA_0K02150 [Tetrapisispora phaffii CBS 4417]|uniref:Iron-sulfur assembly protein 1 n=1 Tax=Tetrapisispora phaffii (strain ATCC 24235 / CBS 4417 / NBRC 1672 / NRRL Y-8282 / UCD 70-5) TaxID=1071381 RepID=G8BZL8_TETPH|nr:hypothetical protein TPHA_0K02150 [Tetrapisispora phaffii CBS 4417]CCE65346.1 hypothetical protein TPHA_0K02150 [Tetrapisispora phaffii CBS 4417]
MLLSSSQGILCDDLILLLRRSTIVNQLANRRLIATSRTGNNTSLLFSNAKNRTASTSTVFKTAKKFDSSLFSKNWDFNYMKKNVGKHNEKVTSTITVDRDTKAKWSNYSLPSRNAIQEQLSSKKRMDEAQLKYETSINDSKIDLSDTLLTNGTKKKRTRTLKPRKALITLSPKAISHLKKLLDQPEPKLIRIGTRNRGCSGLTYDLQYITQPEKFDEIVEQDGVKVIIDSKALFSVVGSEMDWIDDTLSSRFVFKNPNSKGTCGCGESFMV